VAERYERFLSVGHQAAVATGIASVAGPVGYLLLTGLWGTKTSGAVDWGTWLLPAGAIVSALTLAGSLLVRLRPLVGRSLITAGVAAGTGLTGTVMIASPAGAFVTFLGLAVLLAMLWTSQVEEGIEARVVEVRASAIGALGAWFAAAALGLAKGWGGMAFAVVALLTPLVMGAGLLRRREALRLRPWATILVMAAVVAVASALAAVTWRIPGVSITCLAVVPVAALALVRRPEAASSRDEWWEVLLGRPAHLLGMTFLATCLVGGILLSLPVCAARQPIALVDAFFTATSAVCVTGLVVLDTPLDFTAAGEAAILGLIQVGGLGIMTFSTAAIVMLGQRMSLKHEEAVGEIVGGKGRAELTAALARMLAMTFGAELCGALVLFACFAADGDGAGAAAWRALFTSVSAFCNAGFGLQSDNLVTYQRHTIVLHTVSLLIILGGLGPAVVAALPTAIRRRRLPLVPRIVIVTTAVLVAVPALLLLPLEWGGTLRDLTPWQAFSNAWLQSVTCRTAGFNSVDIAAYHPASITLTEILMFIGGSPGGTAGGIKTTTAVILLLAIAAMLRGRPQVVVGGWRLPHITVYKASAVATLYMLAVLAGFLALQLTQDIDATSALFEVISALGTVGLSIGATLRLDEAGKIIIMICMFAGRVGPLTLALMLGSGRGGKWAEPEQEVPIG